MQDQIKINEIKRKEILNPKLSSTWIDIAAPIIAKYNPKLHGFNIYDFDIEQLKIIGELFEDFNIEYDKEIFELLNDPKIVSTKMQIALGAYKNNIDIDVIKQTLDYNIPFVTANLIIQAYTKGFGKQFIEFIINKYDNDQLFEIFNAYEDGINVSSISNKNIPASSMSIIRHALNIGYKVKYDLENKKIIISED